MEGFIACPARVTRSNSTPPTCIRTDFSMGSSVEAFPFIRRFPISSVTSILTMRILSLFLFTSDQAEGSKAAKNNMRNRDTDRKYKVFFIIYSLQINT